MKIKDILIEKKKGKRPIVAKVICDDKEKGFVCNKKTFNYLHNIDQDDKNSITSWANKHCEGSWRVETTSDYVGEERYGKKLDESAKLSKTEQEIINMFIGQENDPIELVYYKGTGRIRGGGAPSGKRLYDTAKKMIGKGILSRVDPKEDLEKGSITHEYITVTLNDPSLIQTELSNTEKWFLKSIKDYNDKNPDYFKWFRKVTKSEERMFEKLKKLGYVDGDTGKPIYIKGLDNEN